MWGGGTEDTVRHPGKRTGLVGALMSLMAGASVLIAPPAHAGVVINVPGGSYPTIQAGIDAASNGDTVAVAPGTYHEHIDFKGKAIEVTAYAGPATTIIDGDGTSHVVVFKSGEGRASVLRRFVITGGSVPASGGPGLVAGAGVAIKDSSPTITRNVITGNNAGNRSGAGVGAVGGAPRIFDNYIHGNSTGEFGAGGGIFAGGGAEIEMNVIEDNTAGGGGGILSYGGTPIVGGNMIRWTTPSALPPEVSGYVPRAVSS